MILWGKYFLMQELYTAVQTFKTEVLLFSKQTKENKLFSSIRTTAGIA
jgi:hypothetical protein